MNRDSEYYYGLPQEIWNALVLEAEDLLSEEEIGNHIVGLYPAGPRIFGIESASPSLLCLYVDAAESVLDPYKQKWNNPRLGWNCKDYTIGSQLSKIYYIELHDWIANLIKLYAGYEGSEDGNLFSLIPLYSDVFYQSESINKIIGLCDIISKENKLSFNARSRSETTTDYKYRCLLYRTFWIWDKKKIFMPNVNTKWGAVFNLEDEGFDKDFIILDNELLESTESYNYTVGWNKSGYIGYLMRKWEKREDCKIEIFNELRKETVNFYRQLL